MPLKPDAMTKINLKAFLKELTLPVLLDRAGGSVEVTLDDWDRVKEKYGGRVAMLGEPIPHGMRVTLRRASDPALSDSESFTNIDLPKGLDVVN